MSLFQYVPRPTAVGSNNKGAVATAAIANKKGNKARQTMNGISSSLEQNGSDMPPPSKIERETVSKATAGTSKTT